MNDKIADRPDSDGIDEAIRNMLIAEAEDADAKPEPTREIPATLPVEEPIVVSQPPVAHVGRAKRPEFEELAEQEPPRPAFRQRLWAAVLGFVRRPDAPRLLAFTLLAVFLIYKPWQVLILALLALVAGLVTYFSLGPDRCAELVVGWFQRLQARDPVKAEQVRGRAMRTSARLSKALSRLPERWTAGLYLPDFQPDGDMPEKMKNDPFDRLDAEVRAVEPT